MHWQDIKTVRWKRRNRMARDRFYEARMQGMIYAFNKAKAEGIEALERDMKKRNLLKLPLSMTESQMEEIYENLTANIYNNMLSVALFALHDSFKFGKGRIRKFKDEFDKLTLATVDLDYMGQHYVRFEDFALEMNERYDTGIDISRVAANTTAIDERRELFRHCHVDKVLQELRENGFADAAVFLEQKLD